MGSSKKLNTLLKYSKDPRDKSGLGYQNTEKIFFKKVPIPTKSVGNFHKKDNHLTSKYLYTKRSRHYGSPKTNLKRPKKIWVPKDLIIPLADVLSNNKRTLVMVPRQWLLTAHDGRKVYVPRPQT